MEKEDWKHILINGKSKQLEVKNPVYTNGVLTSIEGLKPFNKKDKDDNPIEPTIQDANEEKRRIYIEFFKKPFKNLLVLSGAGSSMDVGGLSMGKLWAKAEEKYVVKDGEDIKENGFELICKAVNFDYSKKGFGSLAFSNRRLWEICE